MNELDPLDDLLMCRLDTQRKQLEPCTIVIFGATGDLTARKLIPAFFHLFVGRQLPSPLRIIGFARREKSDEDWRRELREALQKYSRTQPVDSLPWEAFAEHLSYCRGDMDDPAAYAALAQRLAEFREVPLQRNLLFYFAIQPSQFAVVAQNLSRAGLLRNNDAEGFWQRVVVEKPFGHDLASARELNAELMRVVHERQIFRIDHYLGKETIQNILMFRFSNAVFENLWNRQMVDHIQLTLSEKNGVGTRAGFYEEAGALRDVVQNHLLQVLALVAMEPPTSLDAEAIRDEKVKLLNSIRIMAPDEVAGGAVRGQYVAGEIDGESRPGYRREPKVLPNSTVETYVALRLLIDNWRWSGVPFYLRTGKSLPVSASEVRVQFRPTPHVLFAAECGPKLDANAITLRLQPDEGISLRFNGKIPGPSIQIRPVRMHFRYDSEFGAYTPEAYERLLLDALAGDATLFLRRDEVETAWKTVDPIRESWGERPLVANEFYPAGSWGPPAADAMIGTHGHAWRHPQASSQSS